jgi:regulation of enolase protein 1 (concanavalin A-like superfamily)
VFHVPNRHLHESFAAATLQPELQWFCEPQRWAVLPSKHRLRVETDGGTDFWQKTHYGFQADNGHFLFAEVAGDFIVSTHVGFAGVHQYDQAGLMVRLSPSCWLKTSVEYEPEGPSRLGAVVTNRGYSDWSTQEFPSELGQVWLRIRREGSDYLVESSREGVRWSQLRLARLHDDHGGAIVACGLYACSPKAAGFAAEFSFLTIDSGRISGA